VEQADFIRAIIADRRKTTPRGFRDGAHRPKAMRRLLSDGELVALIQILYIGGYETTSHMIGTDRRLLTHPDQWAALRARRS